MSLFGGKVELQVTADRDGYLPGEVIRATIDVVAEKEVDFTEARAELVYENRYRYRTKDHATRPGARAKISGRGRTDI